MSPNREKPGGKKPGANRDTGVDGGPGASSDDIAEDLDINDVYVSPMQDAVYRTDERDAEFKDHPMVLVFPAPLDVEQTFEALAELPPERADDFAELPLELRLERIEMIELFHYPFQHQLALLPKVVRLARKAKRLVKPKDPRVMTAIYRAANGIPVGVSRQGNIGGGGGLGLLITGPSGAGKSSFADRICAHLGDYARRHHSVNGRPCIWPQLGVIRISACRTMSATLVAILARIDEQLGIDYWKRRVKDAKEEVIRGEVVKALTGTFAIMLIIDEFQRIRKLESDAAKAILDGLVKIMEDSGIPVVVIGTYLVRGLFKDNLGAMSKFSNAGAFEFGRIAHGDPDGPAYIQLLKSFSGSISEIQYCEGFDDLLISHACGVPRVMKEYMKALLEFHAEDETLVADDALLSHIGETCLGYLQQALTQLRLYDVGNQQDDRYLQLYEELIPPDARRRKVDDDEVAAKIRRMKVVSGQSFSLTPAMHARLMRARLEDPNWPKEAPKQAQKSPDGGVTGPTDPISILDQLIRGAGANPGAAERRTARSPKAAEVKAKPSSKAAPLKPGKDADESPSKKWEPPR